MHAVACTQLSWTTKAPRQTLQYLSEIHARGNKNKEGGHYGGPSYSSDCSCLSGKEKSINSPSLGAYINISSVYDVRWTNPAGNKKRRFPARVHAERQRRLNRRKRPLAAWEGRRTMTNVNERDDAHDDLWQRENVDLRDSVTEAWGMWWESNQKAFLSYRWRLE